MLPRRLQRHLKWLLIGMCVFLVMCGIYKDGPSHISQSSSEDVEHYHISYLDQSKVPQKGAGMPVFENGRRRVLNTSEGVVYVKDVKFVPNRPLLRGDSMDINQKARKKADSKTPNENKWLGGLLKRVNKAKMWTPAGVQGSIESVSPHNREGIEEKVLNSKVSSCKVPCKENLSDLDSPHFQYCKKKSKLKPNSEPSATTCSFRKADPTLSLVALASPSGSGIDQLRWHLQGLTGVCTGSIWCNTSLRRAGYAGECLRGRSVLAVKTDQLVPFWSGAKLDSASVPYGFKKMVDVPVFDSAVYLMRNPFEAIAEAWNERKLDSANWESFVLEQGILWQQMVVAWLVNNNHHPVLVVRHEDLKTQTKRELLRILKFLNVTYNATKLEEITWVTPGGRESADFRKENVDYVNFMLKKATDTLSAYKETKNISLKEYRMVDLHA